MLKGRVGETRKALLQLGITVSEEEVQKSSDQLTRNEQEREKQKKTLWTPGVKRALVVVGVFFIFQQITGINVPF